MPQSNLMRDRQRPLVELYKKEPSAALVTDLARTEWQNDNPLQSSVIIGPHDSIQVPVAVHSAVGGDSDQAVPGDILCAALASCLDSTMRLVANRMGIEIKRIAVTTSAEADVRGTLMVSRDVRVGFLNMQVQLQVVFGDDVTPENQTRLFELAEGCCVVLETLRNGVPISLTVAQGGSVEGGAS